MLIPLCKFDELLLVLNYVQRIREEKLSGGRYSASITKRDVPLILPHCILYITVLFNEKRNSTVNARTFSGMIMEIDTVVVTRNWSHVHEMLSATSLKIRGAIISFEDRDFVAFATDFTRETRDGPGKWHNDKLAGRVELRDKSCRKRLRRVPDEKLNKTKLPREKLDRKKSTPHIPVRPGYVKRRGF